VFVILRRLLSLLASEGPFPELARFDRFAARAMFAINLQFLWSNKGNGQTIRFWQAFTFSTSSTGLYLHFFWAPGLKLLSSSLVSHALTSNPEKILFFNPTPSAHFKASGALILYVARQFLLVMPVAVSSYQKTAIRLPGRYYRS
jgi:hypothetical protein